MKNKMIKALALIFLAAILCSCSRMPSIGNGDKPEIEADTFKPSTLEGIDAELAQYEKYKKNAEAAFKNITSATSDQFEYSVTESGVRIDSYVGEGQMVVIPSEIGGVAVTEIAPEAFYAADGKASSLRSIYVPDSVKSIGKGAFRDCGSLQLIRLPVVGDGGDKTHIGYVFGAEKYDENAINIPVSLEMIIAGGDIADYAFYGVKSVEAIVLTDAKTIGKFSFWECDQLVYIGFSDALESIGAYAFSSCANLPKIELPESVKSIGFGAFYLCKSMTDMTLSVIGDGKDNTHLGYIFGAETADWNEDFVPMSLKRVTILDSSTRIENKAFANCRGIVEVNFSETLEFIGIRAFVNCRSLASVTTPEGLKTISDDAFFDCDNLTSLTVKGGTKIGAQAFFRCDKLTDKNISPMANVDDSAFNN